jgi:hypothetical protein
MVKLTFEEFSSIIESIRMQFHKDSEYANKLSEALGTEDNVIMLYDNSLLIKSLLSILQKQFPKSGSFCEIEHYMFELNFGKNGEEFISLEELWKELNRQPIISTHPLIDEDRESFNQYFAIKE